MRNYRPQVLNALYGKFGEKRGKETMLKDYSTDALKLYLEDLKWELKVNEKAIEGAKAMRTAIKRILKEREA